MADDWHRTTIHECSHESNIGLGCLGPAVVILFVIALVVAMAQDVADKITGTLRPQQQAIPQQPVYQSPPAAPYVPPAAAAPAPQLATADGAGRRRLRRVDHTGSPVRSGWSKALKSTFGRQRGQHVSIFSSGSVCCPPVFLDDACFCSTAKVSVFRRNTASSPAGAARYCPRFTARNRSWSMVQFP